MKISDLRPKKGAIKRAKRIGRGQRSGHGKTSTRGHKGSGQRSGGGKRFDFEGGQMPLFRRLPKRGFRNKFKKKFQVVNVQDLNVFSKGDEITPEILYKKGVVRKKNISVKILCKGLLDKALTVNVHAFSKSAKAKIEEAGGKVKVITRK